MKKLIKRLLIISQVLGWSALVASACTDNDQTNKNGTVSNKVDTDQKAPPTDAKNEDKQKPDDSVSIKETEDKTGTKDTEHKKNSGHDMSKTSSSESTHSTSPSSTSTSIGTAAPTNDASHGKNTEGGKSENTPSESTPAEGSDQGAKAGAAGKMPESTEKVSPQPAK